MLFIALLAMFATAGEVTAARSVADIATSTQRPSIAKPHLIIEGWLDRNYTSDLYAFDFEGKLLRRLTSEPLPACDLVAVARSGNEIFFVGNASALYGLSLRNDVLWSLHSEGVLAPAVSPRGEAIAFVVTPEAWSITPPTARADAGARPLALRVRPVLGGSRWRTPVQFSLPSTVVPSEMTFAPDSLHVLITSWARGGNAQLVLADLTTGAITPVISDSRYSYYQPVFAPDGKSLLAVREDLDAGRWSIVSIPWPIASSGEAGANRATVVLTGPRGVSISTPIFMADGKRFLFHQNDALARATLDGKTVEPLAGNLDQNDRQWSPLMRHLVDRAQPTRASWLPSVVTRYFARLEYHPRTDFSAPATADVIIIDVETKERRVVPIPRRALQAAVIVE